MVQTRPSTTTTLALDSRARPKSLSEQSSTSISLPPIVVAGGAGSSGVGAAVRVIDWLNDTSTAGPSLPGPREAAAMASDVNGTVYVIGGDDGQNVYSTVFAYTPPMLTLNLPAAATATPDPTTAPPTQAPTVAALPTATSTPAASPTATAAAPVHRTCPKHTRLKHGKCVKTTAHKTCPKHATIKHSKCVCAKGYVLKHGKCVKRGKHRLLQDWRQSLDRQAAKSSARPSLGAIALSTRDLPGFRLIQQGPDSTTVQGDKAGHTWVYSRPRRANASGIFRVVNTVFRYNSTVNAAAGMGFTGARACSSHAQNFDYREISAAIGDLFQGCYYPVTIKHVPNVPVVAVALRRFAYVTVIRAYGTPATNGLSMQGTVEHWAAIVDRRIELATHGLLSGSHHGHSHRGAKHPSGRSLTISRCHQRGCIFQASGRGTTMYAASFSGTARRWRFTPPTPLFTVHFKFDCGPVNGQRSSFLLTEVDDVNETIILREMPDQRNTGSVTGKLPAGGKRVALLVQVYNNSCTWSVVAKRYVQPAFPQP